MTTGNVTVIKDLLPPKKAAEYLGISTMTLWRWTRGGKIAAVMLDHTYYQVDELDRVKAAMNGNEG